MDTNVISEPFRPIQNLGVLRRLEIHRKEVCIASVVWHELLFGWERLPDSRKKRDLERYLFQVVRPSLPTLPYDSEAAEWHARERARLGAVGRTPPFLDGQIAAIAKVNDLVLVTANRFDFEVFEGLQIEDWRA
ncbi:MAG: type II toxin-antitoxin system VapC family toxin [Thermoanaerobaculia bacterium]